MNWLRIKWHSREGHVLRIVKGLSVSMFDIAAKGELYDCSCGKGWAR